MQNQRGFTTLLVSLILVMLVSLNVIIGSRSSALEVKSANNLYRTEAAFQNAEQGIRAMLTQLNATITAAPDVALSNTKRVDSLYTVNFCTAASADCVASSSLPFPFIKSTGVDPSGATRTISQRVTYSYSYTAGTPPLFTTSVPNALNALGMVSVSGNVTIDSAIAGGSINNGGSADIKTTNSSDFYQQSKDADGNTIYLYDAHGGKIKWTSDEFFMYYFHDLCPATYSGYQALFSVVTSSTSIALAQKAAKCQAEVKATVTARTDGYICSSSCDNTKLLNAYSSGKRIMWLSGTGMKINAKTVIGSASDPVIIFVMEGGTIQINGGSQIYGVVYVDVPEVSSTVINVTNTSTCNCQGTSLLLSKDSKGNNAQWSDTFYGTASTATQWCTTNACEKATSSLCSPSKPSSVNKNTPNGTASTCNYSITVQEGTLSSSAQTQVTIEVLGDWNNSGGGTADIYGAVLTSGNFSSTGTLNIHGNAGLLPSFQPGTPGSSTNTLTTSSSGWSDMN